MSNGSNFIKSYLIEIREILLLTRLIEGFVADITDVGLFTCVDPFVHLQHVHQREAFAAVLTEEAPAFVFAVRTQTLAVGLWRPGTLWTTDRRGRRR